jgi:hypothetical protein
MFVVAFSLLINNPEKVLSLLTYNYPEQRNLHFISQRSDTLASPSDRVETHFGLRRDVANQTRNGCDIETT